MGTILVRRLVSLSIILVGVSIITFLLMYITPGDPAWVIARGRYGESTITPEMLEAVRVECSLDQPLPIQYLRWAGKVIRGDLGESFLNKKPVAPLLVRRFLVTLQVATLSLVFSLLLALPLGIAAALKPMSWIDTISILVSQIGVSVPLYWLGPLLILLLAIHLGALPTAGWGNWKYLILPAVTLGFRPLAFFTRMVRSGLLEVLGEDYIRTARAKGLSKAQVIQHHALKNAFIPVVTVIGLQYAGMLGGAVIVEVIFAVPGVGRMLYEGVMARDLPVIQACVLLVVGLTGLTNVLMDCCYVVLNPTIRYGEQTK